MSGRLSIVATPIGNLEDITLRAVRVLREADVVFCEDTRVTGKLLKHLDIEMPLKRCDAEREAKSAEEVIALLQNEKRVAYVSDAGTPGVSDPGARLVNAVRQSVIDCVIETIPGASSVTAALAVAGISETSFTFLGFVPHKKGRETFFKNIAQFEHPVIFFESPHRIMKTLESLINFSIGRKVYIGRELTKMHEEMLIGKPEELATIFTENPKKVRGEFVVIVE